MIHKKLFHQVLYLIYILGLAASNIAGAEVINANPDNYRSLVGTLGAGDVLQLEAGAYTQGLNLSGVHGEEGNPITISGPESGDAAVFSGRACCNTVQLGKTSYVTIRHITIDGQDIDYIDAVKATDITHHITVEHLLIINHGGSKGPDTTSQLTVGISTKAPAWDWIIRHNTIIEAGTGIYLGDSTGYQPFVRGVIEYNLIFDTLGYNMQIKHQKSDSRPADIGLPAGDNKTIIRHNVFSKIYNASTTGKWARPNLLIGHLPLSGEGSNDSYEIYGNFFYQNPSEALIQGEGNIALYNNVFVNDFGRAINIMPHNDVPKNIAIFYNTVVAAGRGINVSSPDAIYTQFVSANAVFGDNAIATAPVVVQSDNVTDSYANSINYLMNPINLEMPDLFPVAGMLSAEPISGSLFSAYSDWDKDFNGVARKNTIRGAYSGESTNPGWKLAREIKTITTSADTTPPPEPDTAPAPGSGSQTDSTQNADDSAQAGAFSQQFLLALTIIFLSLLLHTKRRTWHRREQERHLT